MVWSSVGRSTLTAASAGGCQWVLHCRRHSRTQPITLIHPQLCQGSAHRDSACLPYKSCMHAASARTYSLVVKACLGGINSANFTNFSISSAQVLYNTALPALCCCYCRRCLCQTKHCSQPVQQLSTGCYNFCRFALLEGGQTSSSCCSSQAQPAASREPLPARHVIDGFAAATADAKTSSSTPSVSASEAIAAQQQQQLQGSQTTRQSAEGLLSQALQQQQAQTHPTSSPCTHQQQQTAACEQDLAALALQQSSMQAVDAAGEESPAGAAAAAAAAAQDDLTEAAEEQLMLRDTTGTNSSSSSSSSTGHGGAASSTASILGSGSWGPCYLAMPADDPAHLGVWQLGGGGSSRSSSSSQRPLMLLQQSKGPDRPHRGQCMAVVLLQPQVG